MNIPRLYFPHISRIFSAGLWLLLLAFIGFNIFLKLTIPLSYSDKLINVFGNPLSWDTHVALARALWQNGPKDRAIQEMLLAVELSPKEETPGTAQVLGVWQNEPLQQKQQEEYWQTILTRYSDYRDAYIQLAALSYRERNLPQAHAYLLKAQILDPNNATVNRLVTVTSKLLE